MGFNISVKIREIGDVQGTFLKATKNSIYLQNVLMNRTTTTKLALLKIERKYVISVDSVAAPSFDTFTNEELSIAQHTSPRYADTIKNILDARSGRKTGFSQNIEAETNDRAFSDKKESAGRKNKKTKEWDQFEVNSELFGVNPKFDMNEYTSPIDTESRTYKGDLEKSEKIAGEIMSQKTEDPHRLEERGISMNMDVSDESRFSTVKDSSKWDVKTPPQATGKENSRESLITIFNEGKSTAESTMEEELNKKKKEVMLETTNENPDSQKMWASLKQFLSLKKKVEDSTNPISPITSSPAERPCSPASTFEGKSSPILSEQSNDSLPPGDESGSRSSKNYAGQHKEERGGDRDGGRNFRSRENFHRTSYRSYRRPNEFSDGKTQKHVIIGGLLRYKSANELISRIVSNFSSASACAVPRESWGTGCIIEDRIDQIKNKQMRVIPSMQRLSDIFLYGPYRSKK
ncbi:hypothetical protein PAEPH01_0726 [Pancytospora epiphaga]|nr:hypothetical protein PAEPH01_0726 [Pancytospora epiphaga]